MRIVSVEEHFSAPDLVARIDKSAIAARGWPGPNERPSGMAHFAELKELGEQRLADMDAAGITIQVLSVSGPGADLLDPGRGPDIARAYNDRLAEALRSIPVVTPPLPICR